MAAKPPAQSALARNSGAALQIVRGLLIQDARDEDMFDGIGACRFDFAICELDLEAAAADGDPVTELQEQLESLQAHMDSLQTTLKCIGALARIR